MRNFTPFVEGNMAYDVVHILNRFFSALGEAILMNNGLIYQYVGDEIVPKNVALGFRELGRRHTNYGVSEGHYLLVRKVLVDTLKARLKESYSDRIRLAWERMFDLAFKYMKEGAAGKKQARTVPKPAAVV